MFVKIIDLFSGIGGLSKGFKDAGFELALALDIDKYAVQTYNYNLGDGNSIARIEDINKLTGNKILEIIGEKKNGEFGIITGPPCKGFSTANFHREKSKSKHKLYTKAIELIDQMKPVFFVIENVPGITSLEQGKFYERAVKKINSTKYKIVKRILNATDFGVPQIRKRVFIIGMQEEFEFNPQKNKEKITVEQAISDLPNINEGEGKERQEYPTVNCLTPYQEKMRKGSTKLHNHIITVNSEIVKRRYQAIPEGKRLVDVMNQLDENLRINVKFGNVYWRFRRDEPAPTIVHPRKSMYIHYKYNRGYSIREIARLQSLPDTFIFKGPKTYQQQHVADAVSPLMAKAIAKEIKKRIKKTH
ncbi:MAG: DNA cytosine methyltransferase [Candidatus Heimdallarchaeaceae archaeon]